MAGMTSAVRYAVGDLARLFGVSRRTVRYYVQEGLISPPFGVGRGNHYGPEHLEQILHVKAQQEAGRTLDEIRAAARGPEAGVKAGRRSGEPAHVERSLWRRLSLAPGVELHVAGHVRLPSPGRRQELAAWCRLHGAYLLDEERWATALALAWLERNAGDTRDEWRMLAEKARRWLNHAAVRPPDGADWLDNASRFITR